ncbi:T9SS type A sorting domain-containing protein [Empedobacter tilapiae]|uniref:T9SS type A sorting domain-containing protein n=1 Tax=Empedobacter tilapiae TaxID=2491114 RepID=A0A4Z1BPZ8_9FLAO|nr:T9SS type A sorting domain-containing protein [Empedobacter tilapiae]TGN27840.1 T9SS type A sorting domain-containing protein [Empedobacter tilapiae]
MKKFLFSGALLASTISFAQITLEKTFSKDEKVHVISNNKDISYVSATKDNKLVLYNSDYSIIKIINVDIPSGYTLHFYYDSHESWFTVSKHIFNTDNNYEFVIEIRNNGINKTLIIDENGKVLKDFSPNETDSNYELTVFHDEKSNKNKLIIDVTTNNFTDTYQQVYVLPTSSLSIEEVKENSKLQAFPNPAQSTLNIVNPKNGANNVEIYDITGRLILKKDFNSNESNISVDVQDLSNGNYIYKIGNSSAKFIKK